MRFDLVIFDLDGTILDTLGDLASAVNFALEENGLPARTTDEVRMFVGNGVRKLVSRAVPAGTPDGVIEAVYASFGERYRAHSAELTRPYDGIAELLAALGREGIKLAVVSNKPDDAVGGLCGKYFPDTFDMTVGARDGVPHKPSPQSVSGVIDALGCERAKTAYVGDSDVDIMTAKNAGIEIFSAAWGFRSREFLIKSGAVRLYDTPRELTDALLADRDIADIGSQRS